jgi:hypothetical protein
MARMQSPADRTDVFRSSEPDGAMMPTASVVIGTKDRAELFARSLAAVLDQDYPGTIECIVVYDSEPYPGVVDVPDGDRRIVTMRNERSPGLAGARNTGILAASGEFLAFCDDDDVWYPAKLRRQVEVLRASPTASVVGCDIEIDHDGVRTTRSVPIPVVRRADLVRDRITEVHPSSVLCRLETVRSNDVLVDERLPGSYGEDYDWLLRMTAFGDIHRVAEVLVTIYWHRTSFFASRWTTIAEACGYLLAKHPEIRADPQGMARLEAKRAFALAASGDRRGGARSALQALRRHPTEQRAWAALVASSGLVSAERIQGWAQARGRGI